MSEDFIKWENIAEPLVKELDALKGEFRASIIVLQSHIDFMIDKLIETLVESNAFSARKIGFVRKLDLLLDLGYIKKETYDDLTNLYDIRAICAHDINVNSSVARTKIEEKFRVLKIIERGKSDFFPEIDIMQTSISNLSQFLLKMLHARYEQAYKMKKDKTMKIELGGDYDLLFKRISAKVITDAITKSQNLTPSPNNTQQDFE